MYQSNQKIYKLPDSDFTNSKWAVRLDAVGLISMWNISLCASEELEPSFKLFHKKTIPSA